MLSMSLKNSPPPCDVPSSLQAGEIGPWRRENTQHPLPSGGGDDIMACPEAPRHVHTLTLPLPLCPSPPPCFPIALLQDVFSQCPARLIYRHHFNPVMPQLRASRCLQNKGQTHLEAELSLPCLARAASPPPPQGCALPSHRTSLSPAPAETLPLLQAWLQHTPFILQTFTE